MQNRVGIRVLKDHLSQYVQRARSGEQVVITDRGRPVALLSPLQPGPESETGWELVRQGVASWSGGKPRGGRRPPRLEGSPASDAVLEDRR